MVVLISTAVNAQADETVSLQPLRVSHLHSVYPQGPAALLTLMFKHSSAILGRGASRSRGQCSRSLAWEGLEEF